MKNRVNCWKPLRAHNTTTESVMINVTVGKGMGLGNQQPSLIRDLTECTLGTFFVMI